MGNVQCISVERMLIDLRKTNFLFCWESTNRKIANIFYARCKEMQTGRLT